MVRQCYSKCVLRDSKIFVTGGKKNFKFRGFKVVISSLCSLMILPFFFISPNYGHYIALFLTSKHMYFCGTCWWLIQSHNCNRGHNNKMYHNRWQLLHFMCKISQRCNKVVKFSIYGNVRAVALTLEPIFGSCMSVKRCAAKSPGTPASTSAFVITFNIELSFIL